jgi:tetratricopeptide (TPR) repeat protein
MSKTGIVAGVAFLVASHLAQAQPMAASTDNSLAIECYNRSVQAASVMDARFADIQTCDAAINSGALSSNDLQATLVNRGLIYGVLGRLDRARDDLGRAMDIAGDVPEIYLNLGNMDFLAENWSQAITQYDRAEALGLVPQHVLYLNRGMALEQSGFLDEAEVEYRAALELMPEWQPVLDKLQRVEMSRLEQQEPQQTTEPN